jgi:hypothetical protein
MEVQIELGLGMEASRGKLDNLPWRRPGVGEMEASLGKLDTLPWRRPGVGDHKRGLTRASTGPDNLPWRRPGTGARRQPGVGSLGKHFQKSVCQTQVHSQVAKAATSPV